MTAVFAFFVNLIIVVLIGAAIAVGLAIIVGAVFGILYLIVWLATLAK